MRVNVAFKAALLACACALASTRASAASTVRLVYGEDWSRAGRAVKKTLTSAEFKSLSKGQYVVELVNESGGKASEANLGALKLPAIFAISEGGNCYYVIENVPAEATAKKILARIRQVDQIRTEAERAGFDTAEACGEFLSRMERYVGGPRRIVAKGFYEDVFNKLKKLDPSDSTSWVRHFTLGEEFDRNTKADGLELVIKANEFREKGNLADGQSFIDNEKKKPRKHLTKEQQQGILMAQFALYRDDASKTEELNRILARVAEFDETTFWGTAALGWLNIRKAAPLSVYWGWHKGDFKGPKLAATVRYGVDCSFPKAGRYTLSFVRDNGSADAPRIDSVALYAGKELVATLDKPQVVGATTTFETVVSREYRGRINTMVVKGTAGATGESSGAIRIERRVLRARKASGSGAGSEPTKDGTAADYIRRTVGDAALAEIRRNEGGAAFLKRFLADAAWTEQFAGSGPWDASPWRDAPYKGDAAARLAGDAAYAAKALKALDLLVWNDRDDFITTTKIGRNIATALALNHGGRFDDVKLVQVMECYREWAKDGTLFEDAWKHDVRQWREVLSFGQNAPLPVEDLRWIHDFANVDAPRYYGVCWSCAYRLFNCFGASVHGSDYYRPWSHRWFTQELRYRVGGVCGALSKFGSHCAAAHGVRSYTAGQPGHCAYMLWDYSVDRWGIAYAVTAHTGPHFSLGGQGFAAAEDSERYFRHPRRMDAERLRWKGDYAKALRLAPGNYQAAEEWKLLLQAKKRSESEWPAYGEAVLAGFKENPAAGWQLYLPYLDQIGDRAAKLAAAQKGLRQLRESPDETFEAPYYDELALKPLLERFKGDDEAGWALFEAALDGQAKTRTFYRQAINWGASALMTDAGKTKRFLQIVGANAAKTGAELDYRGMVLKASQSGDIAMFRQVYSLMDRLSPKLAPPAGDKSWPLEANGGKLLSAEGLLATSSTSNWDQPIHYRNALDAKDYKDGNAFHTGKDKSPWATVQLPGLSDITAVTAVNAGGNGNQMRQVPLRMWVSEDGADWREIYKSESCEAEWKCTLTTPVKAKFVRVGRAPEAKQDFFHLHKILVYGKKLY